MADQQVPRESGHLAVGDGQTLYWEEWGAPDGVPALYVHGGPGGTLRTSAYRNSFDLTRTRVVGFEQRGCGRSAPHVSDPAVSLATNDTPHLIGDIEALREHLNVEAWIVNGVSWGSTLNPGLRAGLPRPRPRRRAVRRDDHEPSRGRLDHRGGGHGLP